MIIVFIGTQWLFVEFFQLFMICFGCGGAIPGGDGWEWGMRSFQWGI